MYFHKRIFTFIRIEKENLKHAAFQFEIDQWMRKNVSFILSAIGKDVKHKVTVLCELEQQKNETVSIK